MRKTRLVILPGVRTLNKIGCLLLFLACPNIAFKGQENREVEPLCKAQDIKEFWVQESPWPGDVGGFEARNDDLRSRPWLGKLTQRTCNVDATNTKNRNTETQRKLTVETRRIAAESRENTRRLDSSVNSRRSSRDFLRRNGELARNRLVAEGRVKTFRLIEEKEDLNERTLMREANMRMVNNRERIHRDDGNRGNLNRMVRQNTRSVERSSVHENAREYTDGVRRDSSLNRIVRSTDNLRNSRRMESEARVNDRTSTRREAEFRDHRSMSRTEGRMESDNERRSSLLDRRVRSTENVRLERMPENRILQRRVEIREDGKNARRHGENTRSARDAGEYADAMRRDSNLNRMVTSTENVRNDRRMQSETRTIDRTSSRREADFRDYRSMSRTEGRVENDNVRRSSSLDRRVRSIENIRSENVRLERMPENRILQRRAEICEDGRNARRQGVNTRSVDRSSVHTDTMRRDSYHNRMVTSTENVRNDRRMQSETRANDETSSRREADFRNYRSTSRTEGRVENDNVRRSSSLDRRVRSIDNIRSENVRLERMPENRILQRRMDIREDGRNARREGVNTRLVDRSSVHTDTMRRDSYLNRMKRSTENVRNDRRTESETRANDGTSSGREVIGFRSLSRSEERVDTDNVRRNSPLDRRVRSTENVRLERMPENRILQRRTKIREDGRNARRQGENTRSVDRSSGQGNVREHTDTMRRDYDPNRVVRSTENVRNDRRMESETKGNYPSSRRQADFRDYHSMSRTEGRVDDDNVRRRLSLDSRMRSVDNSRIENRGRLDARRIENAARTMPQTQEMTRNNRELISAMERRMVSPRMDQSVGVNQRNLRSADNVVRMDRGDRRETQLASNRFATRRIRSVEAQTELNRRTKRSSEDTTPSGRQIEDHRRETSSEERGMERMYRSRLDAKRAQTDRRNVQSSDRVDRSDRRTRIIDRELTRNNDQRVHIRNEIARDSARINIRNTRKDAREASFVNADRMSLGRNIPQQHRLITRNEHERRGATERLSRNMGLSTREAEPIRQTVSKLAMVSTTLRSDLLSDSLNGREQRDTSRRVDNNRERVIIRTDARNMKMMNSGRVYRLVNERDVRTQQGIVNDRRDPTNMPAHVREFRRATSARQSDRLRRSAAYERGADRKVRITPNERDETRAYNRRVDADHARDVNQIEIVRSVIRNIDNIKRLNRDQSRAQERIFESRESGEWQRETRTLERESRNTDKAAHIRRVRLEARSSRISRSVDDLRRIDRKENEHFARLGDSGRSKIRRGLVNTNVNVLERRQNEIRNIQLDTRDMRRSDRTGRDGTKLIGAAGVWRDLRQREFRRVDKLVNARQMYSDDRNTRGNPTKVETRLSVENRRIMREKDLGMKYDPSEKRAISAEKGTNKEYIIEMAKNMDYYEAAKSVVTQWIANLDIKMTDASRFGETVLLYGGILCYTLFTNVNKKIIF